MGKSPQDPKQIFEEITFDYKGLYGEDLVSILCYGSAARGEYRPGKSDINLMIVLSEKGIEDLDRSLKVVKKWRKSNVAVPLFVTRGYVRSSLDVFPIEYLDLQRYHTLVYGEDILQDLVLKPEFLRLQCEREIKGKLLLLREAFLNTDGKAKALHALISDSILSILAVFEALLDLKGEAIPEKRRDLIQRTAETFDIDGPVFETLLAVKEDKVKMKDDEMRTLFKTYLSQVRALSTLVDEFGG